MNQTSQTDKKYFTENRTKGSEWVKEKMGLLVSRKSCVQGQDVPDSDIAGVARRIFMLVNFQLLLDIDRCDIIQSAVSTDKFLCYEIRCCWCQSDTLFHAVWALPP
jgi:hypothetical protein